MFRGGGSGPLAKQRVLPGCTLERGWAAGSGVGPGLCGLGRGARRLCSGKGVRDVIHSFMIS